MTRWTQHGTDSLLKQRVTDIEAWGQSLTKTLQDVDSEISSVREKNLCIVSSIGPFSYSGPHIHIHVIQRLSDRI